MALWKIDVHLISTFVNKSLYHYKITCFAKSHDDVNAVFKLEIVNDSNFSELFLYMQVFER